ncbi:MAG: exo-alpha-sialidase [Clostridia bacterium]|nr:exo-alpha-sialidase [Clostridia bacterium]
MKLLKKEFVFTGTPSVPSCHASTLVRLADGTVICAWFAGTHEKHPDVGIWYTVGKDGVWSDARRIPSKKQIAHWNPVLFVQKDGTVHLCYKVGETIPDWKTMTVTLDATFEPSTPHEFIPGDRSGGRGPVKNKPIYTSSGTLLAPASTERGVWKPFVDLYDASHGWQKIDIPTNGRVNLIQPTLWEAKDGSVHALMRSNDGHIYRSDSCDGGKSWCEAYPTDLPNNNSGIDCVMTADGRLALVCNPVKDDWGKRTPLSVLLSSDGGNSFFEALQLENDEGEYSYPAVISHGDRLFITYTWRRTAIAYCEIQL